MKIALITGITGQDGSYLAELLLEKGYEVHGIIRRSSSFNTSRIDHIIKKIKLHYGDVTDAVNIFSIIQKVRPNEIYNLAAQSHVKVSFEMPEYTGQVDALGTLNILEAIRAAGLTNQIKFYQASTSELYGKVVEIPQSETTPFYPRSPYAVAKLYSYWIVKNYRESYGMFAVNGILFNHESPRRGLNFVTRKITNSIAKIIKGQQSYISLGNLNAQRDWGHAKDYVKGMWLMMQQETPEDFVLATGKTYSVKRFVEEAFKNINIKIEWQGEGINEVGINSETKEILIRVDERYYRPVEVDLLIGNPTKAIEKLNWESKIHSKNLLKKWLMKISRQLKVEKFFINKILYSEF